MCKRKDYYQGKKAPRPICLSQQVCSSHHKDLFMPSDLVILLLGIHLILNTEIQTILYIEMALSVCVPKLFF